MQNLLFTTEARRTQEKTRQINVPLLSVPPWCKAASALRGLIYARKVCIPAPKCRYCSRMIITRSPLRISLGGGGTDLPSYYRRHSGFLISAAIDKFVYITLHQTFQQELIVKYSKMEHCQTVEDVQHPIVREALKLVGITDPHLEITSMADIPAGTGLGSSGSFTTALLKALHTYRKNIVHPRELAEQACDIEINKLKEPVGKQDQFIAAYGGLTCFKFLPNDTVEAQPLKITAETLYNLEDSLVMFFTGFTRSAGSILKEQDTKSKGNDQEMIENLHFVKELGYQSMEALESGDLRKFAHLMNVHWQRKKQRAGGMSNSQIDKWYALALENGAMGGKLIGAGGGGFLMFYTEEKTKLRHALVNAGLREVRFRFDFEGTKTLIQ
jgi:D-glycero-alpha-D-manno-heptose-7-phosphate kinase